MERVFFIPVVVEVCGCRHLGLAADPPEPLISSGLDRDSSIRRPRAHVGNARICVVRSTFGGSAAAAAAAARSRKKRPHCLTFQLLPSHINEMQTSIPSHCARFQPNVLPVWLKPATIVSVPAVRHHSCRLSSERVNYVWVQTFGYSCLRLGDEVFFSTDPVNGCEANL